MPTTPRMRMTLPEPDKDPWYDMFVAMMASIDAHLFAAFEDRNLFVTHGGAATWDLASQALTFDATLYVTAPSTGQRQSLAAATWTLADGEMLAVDVARGTTAASSLTGWTSQAADAANDSTLVLALRAGSKIYFRNGRALEDGDSIQIFEGSMAGGGGGGGVDRVNHFTGNGSTAAFVLASTPDGDCLPMVFVQGVLYEETADYAIVGDTVTFTTAPVAGQRIQIRYWT